MELSQLLARVIGPYLCIAGLGLLISRQSYLALIDEVPHNKAMSIGFGAISLLTGLLLLQFHNIWSADWRIMITMFGWIATIKGAAALIYPDAIAGLSQTYRENRRLLVLNTVITLLFGVLLCFKGYLA